MAVRAILVASLLVAWMAPALAAEPEPWLTGLEFPVNMAWAPDGTLFYAEKELGNVRMVVDGTLLPEPVAHVDVFVTFETGLLGLVAHPDWPEEPWLYLSYSDSADGFNRLIRVRVANGREIARETIFEEIRTSSFHNGGELLFGPDGMLYLTTGDATEGDPSQDPRDPRGKILRLTPEGTPPSENPTEGSLLYSLGHRNSFGLCVDPATDDLWETENGEPVEELNRIVAGGNYGWPIGQGPLDDGRFRDPVMTLTEAAPTGCAVWRDAVYFGTYTRGQLLRWPLEGGRPEVVRSFEAPVYDVSVGPDDRLYVSTADTIWRFADPPDSAAPLDPVPERGLPPWVLVTVGMVLAVSLFVTLRLAARRR